MNYNPNEVPLPIADIGFSGAIHNRMRWDDNIKWYNIPDRVVVTLRFFGPISVYYYHWFKTRTGKKFPSICSGYDQTTQSFIKGKCPYEDDFIIPQLVEDAKRSNPLFDDENDPTLKEIKAAKSRITGFGHVLVRNNFQANDRNAGKAWHPIKIPTSVLFTLLKLKNMNRITIQGKIYEADIADPYWGRDIHLMYNSTERNPTQRYMINLGEHTPLTEIEKGYLTQLAQWQNIVEYPQYEELKQQLMVNGYYQMLNQLQGVSSTFDHKQPQQQFAHMEQYLPQVPKSPYGDTPMPYPSNQQVPTMPQQIPNLPQPGMSYPQMPSTMQQGQGQGQGQGYVPQMQMQIPQQQMPQAPIPNMGMNVPNMGMQQNQFGMGMTEADIPRPSPLPQNVPPPLGMGMPLSSDIEEALDDIPFDGGDVVEQHSMPTSPVTPKAKVKKVKEIEPEVQATATPIQSTPNVDASIATVATGKTYSVRGKPNGVSSTEFQQIILDFGNNLPRAKPFKTVDDVQLEGFEVLACYGGYCGDLNCVKCPLRQFCLHV